MSLLSLLRVCCNTLSLDWSKQLSVSISLLLPKATMFITTISCLGLVCFNSYCYQRISFYCRTLLYSCMRNRTRRSDCSSWARTAVIFQEQYFTSRLIPKRLDKCWEVLKIWYCLYSPLNVYRLFNYRTTICTNVNHGRLLQQVLQSAKKKPIGTDSGSLREECLKELMDFRIITEKEYNDTNWTDLMVRTKLSFSSLLFFIVCIVVHYNAN